MQRYCEKSTYAVEERQPSLDFAYTPLYAPAGLQSKLLILCGYGKDVDDQHTIPKSEYYELLTAMME